MRRRQRLRRIPPGSVFSFMILVGVLVILVQGLLLAERRLRPAITAVAIMKADGLATDAVSYAIIDKVALGIRYQDLIIIEQDEQGRIVMAQANTMEVNRIMAQATLATREALDNLSQTPFEIPLGEIMDSYLLATYGPRIPVRLIPLGRVNTTVTDSFEGAGINQTRHKIYLKIYAEVQVIVPFIKESVEVITTVPVADTIYIGDVPGTVINLQLPREIYPRP